MNMKSLLSDEQKARYNDLVSGIEVAQGRKKSILLVIDKIVKVAESYNQSNYDSILEFDEYEIRKQLFITEVEQYGLTYLKEKELLNYSYLSPIHYLTEDGVSHVNYEIPSKKNNKETSYKEIYTGLEETYRTEITGITIRIYDYYMLKCLYLAFEKDILKLKKPDMKNKSHLLTPRALRKAMEVKTIEDIIPEKDEEVLTFDRNNVVLNYNGHLLTMYEHDRKEMISPRPKIFRALWAKRESTGRVSGKIKKGSFLRYKQMLEFFDNSNIVNPTVDSEFKRSIQIMIGDWKKFMKKYNVPIKFVPNPNKGYKMVVDY